MELPFTSQPLAFPNLDLFTIRKSPAEQAAMYAQALDQGFKRQVLLTPELNPTTRVNQFFSAKAKEFLAGPVRPDGSLKVTANGLATYQKNNGPMSIQQAYQKIMADNGGIGKEKGQYIASILKAALAIASRASEAQLESAGVSTGKNPGMLKSAFPTRTQDSDAGKMVGILGKFMEPLLLRETLLNYRAGSFDSTLRGTEMGEMLMQQLSPGNNIAQEVSTIQNTDLGHRIHRQRIADKIRFQRSMPFFSTPGSTTQHIIRKVHKQQTSYGNFKPRPSGRFLFDD